jgi:LCP family protein required for cell wall assembly
MIFGTGATENKTEENNESEIGEDHMDEFYRFTILIMGIDNGESQDPSATPVVKEADAVILMDINSRTKTFMLSYLPRDMKIDYVKGYTLRLGAVYAEHDAEMLMRVVRSYTGIRPDFYCVLDYSSIAAVFDILGEVQYTVPINMYHSPNPPVVEINLHAGAQMINGEKAVQLLRFKGYGSGYNHEETGRINTHRGFLYEVIKQKLTLENLSRTQEIYDAVIASIVDTNMDSRDFANYAHLIFGFSDYEFNEISYLGTRELQNGVDFFLPMLGSAMRDFKPYRR